jgi:hypothetical protein
VEHKPASLHGHATERLERLRALLDRLESEGAPADPVLDAVRSLLAEAKDPDSNPPFDRPR